MIRLMFKLLFACASIFFAFSVSAQNAEFWSDIQSLANRIEKVKYYQANLDVNMFSEDTATIPNDHKLFKILKYKKRTKIISDFIVTYIDSKYMIIVDSIDRTISILPPDKRFIRKLTGMIIEKSDSSIIGISLNQSLNDKCYRLRLIDEKVSSLNLCFDANTYFINSIIIYYKDPIYQSLEDSQSSISYKQPRVEITYNNIEILKNGLIAFYSDDYVKLKHDKFITSEKYSNYTIIDKLH